MINLPIENTDDQKNFVYTVQAGAFTNATNAAALKKEIESTGMVSFINEKNVAGTVFNVVYIGSLIPKKKLKIFFQLQM